jgi:hypothetical protein
MMHHTRMLSVSAAGTDISSRTRADKPGQPPLMQWSVLLQRRQNVGEKLGIPLFNVFEDPSLPVPPVNMQYSEPRNDFTKEMCSSFVRHVALTHPWHGSPDNAVKVVKVYHIQHTIIEPPQVAADLDPWDPSLFRAWFEGAFSPEGDLLSVERDPKDGTIISQDPFLYWQLPIFRTTKDNKPWQPGMPGDPVQWVDCLTVHAGSSPWEANQTEKIKQ